MDDKTVVLTVEERNAILNAVQYMVDGGLTSFSLETYEGVYNKLKDANDPPFPVVELGEPE